MKEYIVYCRKSQERDERQERSIEDQGKDIRFLMERHGYEACEWIEEAKSAKLPYQRPKFQEMIQRITAGDIKVKGIVCYSLNRLSRNAVDSGALIYAMDRCLIEEVVTPGRIYRNTPEDKLTMNIEFGMSKKYSDDLSIVVTRGMKSHAEQGGWNHKAPFGYKNIREERRAKIVVDPVKAPVIVDLFHRYLSGKYEAQDLRYWLLEMGIGSRKGHPIAMSTVYAVLKNPFYIGYVKSVFGFHKGTHEPILDRETFDEVQKRLAVNDTVLQKPGLQAKNFFVFRGLVHCDQCRRSMSPYRKKEKYVFLGCFNKDCPQSTVSEGIMNQEIMKVLRQIQFTQEEIDECSPLIPEVIGERLEEIEKDLAEIDRKRASLVTSLKNAKQYLFKGTVSEEDFVEEKKRLDAALAELDEKEKRIRLIKFKREQEIVDLLELAKEAPELYETADPDLQRQLVEEVFLELGVREKSLIYRAKPDFEVLKNRRLVFGGPNRIRTDDLFHAMEAL